MSKRSCIVALGSATLLMLGVVVSACGDASEPGSTPPDSDDANREASVVPAEGGITDGAADARDARAEAGSLGNCSADSWCRVATGNEIVGGVGSFLQTISGTGPTNIWAGGGRLLHFTGTTWTNVPIPNAEIVQSVLALPTVTLLSTQTGVRRRDADGSFHLETTGEPFQSSNAAFSVLRAAPSGQVWLAVRDYSSTSYLFRRSLTATPTWTKITVPATLTDVTDFFVDATGDVWLTTRLSLAHWIAATAKWSVTPIQTVAPSIIFDFDSNEEALAITGSAADLWVAGNLYAPLAAPAGTLVRPKLTGAVWSATTEPLNEPTALQPVVNALATPSSGLIWAVGGMKTLGDDPIDGLIEKRIPFVLRVQAGKKTYERLLPQGRFEIGSLAAVWATPTDVWAVGQLTLPGFDSRELVFHKQVSP
jgi:hypothetical protein